MKIKKTKLEWNKEELDEQVKNRVANGVVSPVAWWLIASYLYYVKNISIMKDETFDWLGKWIKDNWDRIEHPNKSLIQRDATFSGYYVRRYPLRVQGASMQLLEELGYGRRKTSSTRNRNRQC